MMKTVSRKAFDGHDMTTTCRLDKHNVGHPTEWWGIVYLTVDGTSLKNKWGGFPSRNVGKPVYIQKIWNTL